MGFDIENGVLISYTDDDNVTDIVIPDSVTSIGNFAFHGCKSLTSITIPDSVTSIGDKAFYYCKNLTSITIPDGVISIGDKAFYYCKNLTSITIPDSVTSIGKEAFSCCKSLTSITIPDSVTSIGYGTFYKCESLISITIPDSVTSIGNEAFYGTVWLNKKRSENSLVIINGILIDGTKCSEDVVIPDSVTSIGDSAFYYCRNLKSITINSNGSSITINYNPTEDDVDVKELEKIIDFMRNEFDKKDTILNELGDFYFQLAVALYLIKKYNNEPAREFFKSNIEKIVCHYIDNNNAESLTNILPLGYVTKQNIDGMIEYAIEKKKPEMQVILTHYKNDNFGFDNGLDKLML